jgi:hypothetical protein
MVLDHTHTKKQEKKQTNIHKNQKHIHRYEFLIDMALLNFLKMEPTLLWTQAKF